MNHEKELKSYQFFGNAVLHALESNPDWGQYSAREEYRVTLELLCTLEDEWEMRDESSLRAASRAVHPYYVHSTIDVNYFIANLVQSYGTMYESVLFKRDLGDLNQENEKLICMWGSLLQTCLGSKNLKESEYLRNKFLMMSKAIEHWGYAWIPTYLIDWKRNEFQPNMSKKFLPVDVVVARHFRGHARQHIKNQSFLAELDEVTATYVKSADSVCRKIWIHWLVVQILRQYFKEVWEATWESSQTFVKKTNLRDQLKNELGENEFKKQYGCPKNGMTAYNKIFKLLMTKGME